jgi:signal transduction histidine kinase
VTVLWGVLLAGSAEFSWLAFPLFFLHVHVLPRWTALLTIALMTAAVIASQWTSSGLPQPQLAMVLGPVFGAVFSVVTGVAYRALYREGENQRRAADELRRTRAELARSQHDAGVLAERERLAREIHDTLAQGFSSIVLISRAAEKSLAEGDAGTAAQRLAIVQQTASENLAEARSFVRGLSSPQLAEASLVESLRRLCGQTEMEAAARGVGLACRFELDGEPVELPQPYKVALLRAVQASLANVRLHARALTAVVTLAFLGTEVTLDIYDDGVGFDPSEPAAAGGGRPDGSGFGLRSLRERVAALQGSLELESAPGEGTVVAVRLPLQNE